MVYSDFKSQLQRTDPELYDLPHPKAARTLGVMALLSSIVGEVGIQILEDLFKDLTKTKGRIIGEAAMAFPSVRKLKAVAERNGRIDLAQLEGFLGPLRYFVNDGRTFEVEEQLDELLSHTDIGASAPIDFFKLPYRVIYFHFGAKGGGLQMHANTVGTTSVLGAYVTELHLTADTDDAAPFRQWAGPNGELTCFEVSLVGRPLRVAADHGFTFMRLYVGPKMSEMSVEDVLKLNFEIFEARGTSETTQEEESQIKQGVTHLAKVLLQIHAEGTQLKDEREESELALRIKGVGSKKQAKLQRRLERVYDRIRISYPQLRQAAAATTEDLTRTVRAHWRRGHFRHQPFGPGRAQSKLLWIQPTLVGELGGETAPTKDYTVGLQSKK